MKILVGCEESQTVCKAFRERGHEAYSCDILECSGGHPEWHILGNVLPIINGGCEFETMDGIQHTILGKWDLLIAHPPCTYLSRAAGRFLYPNGVLNQERYEKGLVAKEFFMKFYNANCDKIAIENPVSFLIFNMPKWSQEIQPYEFGHPFSKKTRLWLKGLPLLTPTKIISEYTSYLPSNTGAKKRGGKSQCGTTSNSKIASKTFEGIAIGMANQWG